MTMLLLPPPSTRSARAPRSAREGFTLIEAILAIVIAIGMLGLILYFYQQASHARQQVVDELDKISAARLILDKITQDLRCARPDEVLKQSLRGESNSVQFLKTEFPDLSAWRTTPDSVLLPPECDLHWVSYDLSTDTNAPAGCVLTRSETPFVGESVRTNSSNALASDTNLPPSTVAAPLTDQLHFVQFRYWDGTNWISSWSAPVLPAGVEVTLGVEALPDGITVEEYPYPVYRRIVYLPGSAITGSKPQSPASTNDLSGNSKREFLLAR